MMNATREVCRQLREANGISADLGSGQAFLRRWHRRGHLANKDALARLRVGKEFLAEGAASWRLELLACVTCGWKEKAVWCLEQSGYENWGQRARMDAHYIG